MPISFPANPTIGQEYTYNSRTWSWDGLGWSPSVIGTGGGISTIHDAANLYQRGQLVPVIGTARWYAPYNITVFEISARVLTAADNTIIIRFNKNGISQAVIQIAANQLVASLYTTSFAMAQNDYLTLDLTQVGSITNPGSDLYIQFRYRFIP